MVWDPPDGQWSRPPAFHDGAAGLVSTADDLLAFARMLLRGGDPVLTADQVRQMSRDHLTNEQREFGMAFLGGRGWGLGTSVVLDGPWAGAIGWDGGLGTSFLVHPERDLAVIVLTQRLFETPQAPATHTDLQAAALAAAASVIAMAVGMQEAVAMPDHHLDRGVAGLLFGGCALYLATYGYTRWAMFHLASTTWLTAALVVLVLMPVAPHVAALVALMLVAVVLIGLNVVEYLSVRAAGSL